MKAVFRVDQHIHFLAIGAKGFFIPFIPLNEILAGRSCALLTPNGTKTRDKSRSWVDRHIHFLPISLNGFFIP
jgi:hypothetical protein